MRKSDSGRGFIGEPRRTACTELVGNDTIIPNEAWAIHGEELKELDMGFPSRNPCDPEYHHVDLENIEKEDEDDDDQEWREEKRLDPAAIVLAGVNLIQKLELEPTKMNCDIVAIYLEKRADGLVGRFLSDLKFNRSEEAGVIVDFFEKMKKFQPSVSERAISIIIAQARTEKHEEKEKVCEIRNNTGISQEAKHRLIAQAQNHHNNGNHLAIRLGQALLGKDKFARLLRAK